MIVPTPDQVNQLVQALKPALEYIQRDQLRDRIATEAMGQLLADWNIAELVQLNETGTIQRLSDLSYQVADAMLAAREVRT